MNVTFLGTSSGVPSLTRNVSSLALKLSQSSEVWLFDCGEGTQHQIMKSNIKSSQIKKIFITHMHGDHIYGLPGLLATLGLSGNSNGIDLSALILILLSFKIKTFIVGIFEARKGLAWNTQKFRKIIKNKLWLVFMNLNVTMFEN